MLLIVFSLSGLLSANPYTLEYSLTGSETVTLESDSYTVEAGWGEPSIISDKDLYEAHAEVYAYISLYTDFLTGDSVVLLTDGVEIQPGWKKTGWFGFFYADFYPWVYHENMGWIYVSEKSQDGAWFSHRRLGWVWTNPKVFPSLYMNDREEWTYLDRSSSSSTFYDYHYKEWFKADRPYLITGSSIPNYGGKIEGLGEYYRWETISIRAVPKESFNFSGWGGDIRSADSQFLEFEAIRDVKVDATFIPQVTATRSPKEVVSGAVHILNKMENLSESERKKSLIELLSKGKSKTSGLSIVDSE